MGTGVETQHSDRCERSAMHAGNVLLLSRAERVFYSLACADSALKHTALITLVLNNNKASEIKKGSFSGLDPYDPCCPWRPLKYLQPAALGHMEA